MSIKDEINRAHLALRRIEEEKFKKELTDIKAEFKKELTDIKAEYYKKQEAAKGVIIHLQAKIRDFKLELQSDDNKLEQMNKTLQDLQKQNRELKTPHNEQIENLKRKIDYMQRELSQKESQLMCMLNVIENNNLRSQYEDEYRKVQNYRDSVKKRQEQERNAIKTKLQFLV